MNWIVNHSINSMAWAQAAAPNQAPGWVNFMPFIILLVMFYFLLIRPQQKKMKQHQAMVSAIKSGDKVVAAGGIHGVVANVKEQTVILRVAEQVKIEVDKVSITTVVAE
ncbi:MAG: preprotein translocase subunit YajC [Candidatus Methylacidiphilales bacterium]